MSDLRKLWVPQPDITAYELAQIAPYLNGRPVRFTIQGWNNWSEGLRRHFIDGDPPLWDDFEKLYGPEPEQGV